MCGYSKNIISKKYIFAENLFTLYHKHGKTEFDTDVYQTEVFCKAHVFTERGWKSRQWLFTVGFRFFSMFSK